MSPGKAKLPVSVFIITKNEEDRVSYAINSVKQWVREVIVVDSGSTDNTVEITKNLGARVIYNKWQGYGPQKVFGEKQCLEDWILNIDADEEVTPELQKEIIALFNQDTVKQHSAYRLTVRDVRLWSNTVPKFGPRTRCIRLYNKRQAGFSNSTVHDSVLVNEGNVGQLKCIVKHYTFRSYSFVLKKIDSYSTAQAFDMYNKGRKPSNIRIVFEPIFAFFKGYILKRNFVFGFEGIILAYLYTMGRLERLIKARELFILSKTKGHKAIK